MAKFVCSVCGYVYEGDSAPAECPQCHAPASKFVEQKGETTWAAEHVVGVAAGARQDIIDDLRMNFNGECSEVGMYLAMARVAHSARAIPRLACTGRRRLMRKQSTRQSLQSCSAKSSPDSTKKNLEMRVEAENGATAGKIDLAKRAKELGLDAIHDTVHEMARDEARHGKAFAGLLEEILRLIYAFQARLSERIAVLFCCFWSYAEIFCTFSAKVLHRTSVFDV